MTILASGASITLALPAGQVAKFNGFGLVQVVPPVPQGVLREAVTLVGGRQTTIGPFLVPVTLFVAAVGSPMEYFGSVPSDPPPNPGESAYVVKLPSLATLQALALANGLDQAATYVDTATGQKYWALNSNTFLSAGGTFDAGDPNWVQSGLLPPASGTIAAATLTAGVAYVEGNRVALPATPLTLTATRDNYIDLRRDGTVIVTPVTVSGAAPAIPANSTRLGFSRTDATNVLSRTFEAFDSLGNWMYNTVSVAMCRVTRASASGYAGAAIALPFPDADLFDNANIHDPVTNNTRFVLPSNGAYAIDCSLIWFAAVTPTTAYTLNVRLDGGSDLVGFSEGYQGAQATQAMRMTGTFTARGGQYVEVFFNPNGATGAVDVTRLSIVRVR